MSANLREIRAELELLRAQEELLTARARVTELQHRAQGGNALRVRTEDIEYLLSTFSGDDDYCVVKWFQYFEDVMVNYNGDDDDRYRPASDSRHSKNLPAHYSCAELRRT